MHWNPTSTCLGMLQDVHIQSFLAAPAPIAPLQNGATPRSRAALRIDPRRLMGYDCPSVSGWRVICHGTVPLSNANMSVEGVLHWRMLCLSVLLRLKCTAAPQLAARDSWDASAPTPATILHGQSRVPCLEDLPGCVCPIGFHCLDNAVNISPLFAARHI